MDYRKKRKQAHTSAPIGAKVLVVLKSGTRFVDKFREKKNNNIIFDNVKIKSKDVKSFTIYRHIQKNW